MKIDCSITKNFMKEFARMCKYMPNCGKCDMNLIGEYGSVCYEDCMSTLQCERYMSDIQEIVQNWSDEYPQLTYFEDLLSKYPDIEMQDERLPGLCRKVLYRISCPAQTSCTDCWNQLIQ